MRIVTLTNADGGLPVHIVAEHVSAIADVGATDVFDENNNLVAEGYSDVRVYLTGGVDINVTGTLADALTAIVGTTV